MTHPNEDVNRRMFEAYGRADTATLRQVLADDVAYHLPGRSPMAGEYRGRDEVLALWERQKAYLDGKPYRVCCLTMPGVADPALQRLGRLHPRLCPRQVLGVRIGRYAGELLDLQMPRDDKRILAITETDGCFADGVSVATGCWLGRRTLRVVYHGKVAATLIDIQTFEAVRIWPDPLARVAAERYATNAPDRWHAQLEAYKRMPPAGLLKFARVTVSAPFVDAFNADANRMACSGCGEEILYGRNVLREGMPLCRSCAGETYYSPLASSFQKATSLTRYDGRSNE